MPPEQARDTRAASLAFRDSQWWLTCALALSQTKAEAQHEHVWLVTP